MQINYIKVDIEFLKLGAEGNKSYAYNTMIIKAVQEQTIMMIIIIITNSEIPSKF